MLQLYIAGNKAIFSGAEEGSVPGGMNSLTGHHLDFGHYIVHNIPVSTIEEF